MMIIARNKHPTPTSFSVFSSPRDAPPQSPTGS
jgi:hypothetical protein